MAAISDFGISPLLGLPSLAGQPAGYHSPELVETKKPTFKSDVYGFGVLLLELLTGKSPLEERGNLPGWVQSVVKEEWTGEVFDADLAKYGSNEEEMVQALQIALACVTTVPDARPQMEEVLRLLEDLGSVATPE